MAPKALDETWQLLEDFAEAARALNDRGGDVVETLCQLTLKVVGGDHASVTSVRSGKFTTVAATSDLPEQADKIQYASGQGPCVDALREHDTFRVDDLAEDGRWPEFGRAASAELGVRSMLAHVVPLDDEVLGALNVYSARPAAFRPKHETMIAIFGATVRQALGTARYQEKNAHLERALHTSRHIGVALGILMTTQQVDLDTAWEILSKASQDKNLKVSDLAEHVIRTGSLEHRRED